MFLSKPGRHKKITIARCKAFQNSFFFKINTVDPWFSPHGLIANFHMGLIWGGRLFEGSGLIKKVFTVHGGLFEMACSLLAIINLG